MDFRLSSASVLWRLTYRAWDTVLNCVVALKVIDRKVAENSAVRSRFLREARAAAQIQHPNVARGYALMASRMANVSMRWNWLEG
jgi:serine/threonine protein kinase